MPINLSLIQAFVKSTKSPFKVYLNKTLPMIENLSHYWDKADGKTKKKILGCIFKEKFEDFNFERCNHIFTPVFCLLQNNLIEIL